METKERILAAALKLYNQKGVNVTTRHIAASMDISAGNLHYHFKHTDDIIKELFDRLVTEFDDLLIRMADDETEGIGSVYAFAERSFEVVYKYRFFFLSFVELAYRIPSIQKTYQQITEQRVKEFNDIFRRLVQAGVFRSDIPQPIWDALVKQVFIVGDFWLSNNALTAKLKGKEAASGFLQLTKAMFFPYLSNAAALT